MEVTFKSKSMAGHWLRTAVLPGESPLWGCRSLWSSEDRRRRALHHAWLRGQELTQPAEGRHLHHKPDQARPWSSGGRWPGFLQGCGLILPASGNQWFSSQALNPIPPQHSARQNRKPDSGSSSTCRSSTRAIDVPSPDAVERACGYTPTLFTARDCTRPTCNSRLLAWSQPRGCGCGASRDVHETRQTSR